MTEAVGPMSGPAGPDDGPEPGSGLYRLLGRIELRFAQTCVLLVTLLVLSSAIGRTAGRPLAWAVDLALFTFAWGVFVGADVVWRRNRMVSIDVVAERLPKSVRDVFQLVNHLLITLFLLAMVFYGSRLAFTAQDRSFDGLPWLSYTWVTLAVPIGCLLMLYTTMHKIRQTVDSVRRSSA